MVAVPPPEVEVQLPKDVMFPAKFRVPVFKVIVLVVVAPPELYNNVPNTVIALLIVKVSPEAPTVFENSTL